MPAARCLTRSRPAAKYPIRIITQIPGAATAPPRACESRPLRGRRPCDLGQELAVVPGVGRIHGHDLADHVRRLIFPALLEQRFAQRVQLSDGLLRPSQAVKLRRQGAAEERLVAVLLDQVLRGTARPLQALPLLARYVRKLSSSAVTCSVCPSRA